MKAIRVTKLITRKSNNLKNALLQSTAVKYLRAVNRQDSDQMFAFLCMFLDLHEIRRTIFD
jgi:hypothetical protein